MYKENIQKYIQNCSEESTKFLEGELKKLRMEYGYHKKKKRKGRNYGLFGENHPCWKGGPGASQKRYDSKNRGLGFIPINEIFEGAHSHHIDRDFIIYIPAKLHNSIWHSVLTGKNMKEMNELAFEYTYRKDRESFDTPFINTFGDKIGGRKI